MCGLGIIAYVTFLWLWCVVQFCGRGVNSCGMFAAVTCVWLRHVCGCGMCVVVTCVWLWHMCSGVCSCGMLVAVECV